jgi:anti-sigma B factor antagonist
MTIVEREIGDVSVLDLDGPITVGADSVERLADKVRSLLQQGRRHLIINLAAVPYIDSTGLGELVRSYATVHRQDGQLKLLNVTERLNDLLVITKLTTVFDLFDDEAAAVASFSAGR